MNQLLTTVVMKTDVGDFSARVTGLSGAELSRLLQAHEAVVERIVQAYDGEHVKGEGDAFWLRFPSVTAAALASQAIHSDLMQLRLGSVESSRLRVRSVIIVGDVLHQKGDLFGEAVNLAGRMEHITPPDETYLSEAAWLTLNKSEVPTEFVGEFSFRGFASPQRVYRVVQTHTTRIVLDQVILISDLKGFTRFVASAPLEQVEAALLRLETFHLRACDEHHGQVLNSIGDAYVLTFGAPEPAVVAARTLCQGWDRFRSEANVPCPLLCGLHRGTIYLFRSFAFGPDLGVTSQVASSGRVMHSDETSSAVLSEAVVAGLPDGGKTVGLRALDLENVSTLPDGRHYRLYSPIL